MKLKVGDTAVVCGNTCDLGFHGFSDGEIVKVVNICEGGPVHYFAVPILTKGTLDENNSDGWYCNDNDIKLYTGKAYIE